MSGLFRCLRVKLVTINTSGYTSAKGVKIRRIMEATRATCAVITETKHTLSTVLPGVGKPLAIEGESGLASGVALVWNPKANIVLLEKSQRIIRAELPGNLQLIGIYGIPETGTLADKSDFWESLDKTLADTYENYTTTIVMGDFNAGHEKRIGGKKPTGGPNIDRLRTLAEKYKLTIQETGPTWQSRRSTRATRTLDRVLIRSNTDLEVATTLDWEDVIADHATLSCKIKFCNISRNTGRPRSVRRTTVDNNCLMWDNWKLELRRELRNYKSEDIQQTGFLNRFWKLRREMEMEAQDSITIIDDSNNSLRPTAAVTAVGEYLRSIWQNDTSDVTTLKFREKSRSQQPTPAEISEAIKNLKAHTAIGMDKLSADQVKRCPESTRLYEQILADIWRTGQLPQDWIDMRVKPIPKKDLRCTPNKIRPITCLSTSLKIVNNILAARNQDKYEELLSPNQHAYRKQHSIWTAKKALLESITKLQKCVVAFLDMTKAYDSVTRAMLHRVLGAWDIPDNEKNLIWEQYTDSYVYVELNGRTSLPFKHEIGVRQGCVLSGWLFNLVMTQVHRNVESILPSQNYSIISYSDDIIIVAPDKATLKVAQRVTEQVVEETGLKLNSDKTTTQSFDLNTPSTEESSTNWLGTMFSSSLSWDKEIQTRIEKAMTAAKDLRAVVVKGDIKIPTQHMLQIIQTLVLVHITNPLDVVTWTEPNKDLAHNCLLEIILENTNLESAKATEYVRSMLGFTEAQKSNKRKKFQGNDKPSLPVNDLVTPTLEDLSERKARFIQVRESRRICELCNKYFVDINSHRTRIHGLAKLPKLEVWCPKCERNLTGGHYVNHICVSDNPPSQAMYPCLWCGSMYSEHGLNRHKATCKKATQKL